MSSIFTTGRLSVGIPSLTAPLLSLHQETSCAGSSTQWMSFLMGKGVFVRDPEASSRDMFLCLCIYLDNSWDLTTAQILLFRPAQILVVSKKPHETNDDPDLVALGVGTDWEPVRHMVVILPLLYIQKRAHVFLDLSLSLPLSFMPIEGKSFLFLKMVLYLE